MPHCSKQTAGSAQPTLSVEHDIQCTHSVYTQCTYSSPLTQLLSFIYKKSSKMTQNAAFAAWICVIFRTPLRCCFAALDISQRYRHTSHAPIPLYMIFRVPGLTQVESSPANNFKYEDNCRAEESSDDIR